MYNKMSSFESVSSDGELCQPVCTGDTDPYYEGGGYYTPLYPADSQNPGNHVAPLEEEGYWGSPCSSSESQEHRDEYSPAQTILSVQSAADQSPYSTGNPYQSIYCSMVYEKNGYVCDEGYYGNGTSADGTAGVINTTTSTVVEHQHHTHNGLPVVRVIKRRNTANKKERRRTQSINSAYSSLRDRIPNVPNDTKLSKIKTLRLAISYIAHLLAVVNGNQDPACDFRAELVPSSRKINAERRAQKNLLSSQNFSNGSSPDGRKIKGRTGWPQHVWALETKTTIK